MQNDQMDIHLFVKRIINSISVLYNNYYISAPAEIMFHLPDRQ